MGDGVVTVSRWPPTVRPSDGRCSGPRGDSVSVHYRASGHERSDRRGASMSLSVGETGRTKADGGKRSRRSYSDEEKQRIVAEACQPGASVADIARRHGVNANLLFNWRRTAQAAASRAAALDGSASHRQSIEKSPATRPPAFIPIGMFGQAGDDGPALIAAAAPVVAGTSASLRASAPRSALDERPGMIEVDLADGTRLRVDAFVNERALRRVLTVLKAAS